MNTEVNYLIKLYNLNIQDIYKNEYYVLVNSNKNVIIQCLCNLKEYNLILNNKLGINGEQHFNLCYNEVLSLLNKFYYKKILKQKINLLNE